MTDTQSRDPLAETVAAVASELMGVTTRNGHNTVGRTPVDDHDDFPEDEAFEATVPKARARASGDKEGEVTRQCLRWLNAQPSCGARKVHQSGLAGAGEPDLDICWHGHTVKIEMKAPGGSRRPRPTPRQNARLLWWQESGARVGWATSLEQVQAILATVGDSTYRYDGHTPGAVPSVAPQPEDL